jgi:hypothetical protein
LSIHKIESHKNGKTQVGNKTLYLVKRWHLQPYP